MVSERGGGFGTVNSTLLVLSLHFVESRIKYNKSCKHFIKITIELCMCIVNFTYMYLRYKVLLHKMYYFSFLGKACQSLCCQNV